MDRTTLLIIVVVGTVAWLLYKRFIKKEKGWGSSQYSPPVPAVENWYTDAMAIIEALDDVTREQREGEWDAKSDDEKAAYAEKFMLGEFGQEALRSYTRKQRIKIGMARYVKDSSDLKAAEDQQSDDGQDE